MATEATVTPEAAPPPASSWLRGGAGQGGEKKKEGPGHVPTAPA